MRNIYIQSYFNTWDVHIYYCVFYLSCLIYVIFSFPDFQLILDEMKFLASAIKYYKKTALNCYFFLSNLASIHFPQKRASQQFLILKFNLNHTFLYIVRETIVTLLKSGSHIIWIFHPLLLLLAISPQFNFFFFFSEIAFHCFFSLSSSSSFSYFLRLSPLFLSSSSSFSYLLFLLLYFLFFFANSLSIQF